MAKINIQAEQAISELKKVGTGLKQLRNEMKQLNTISASTFTKLESGLNGLASSNKRLSDLVKTLSKNLRQNTTQVKHNQRATRKNTTAVNTLTPAIEKLTKATTRNTVSQKKNTAAKKKATAGASKLLGSIGALAGALGFAGLAMSIAWVLTSIVKLTVKFESLGFAIKQTSGDMFESGRSIQFLLELNNKFGASLISTTERWLKFRTAARQSGLTLLETKKIFTSVTKASAVLGLRTDELRGVYLALEQMLSKGKVTTEELRRQLGERLPGAMGIMATSMGVTIRELDKMLKKGEVLSAEVLPGFARALEKAYGIESLETVDNLATAIGKMSGQWEQFVLTVSEGDSLLNKGISGFLETIETILFRLTFLSANFKQAAMQTQGSFNTEILSGYEKRADSLIKRNGELTGSYKSLQTEIEALDLGIQANQEAGNLKAVESLRTKRKEVVESQRLVEIERERLMTEEARANLPEIVKKTKEIGAQLAEAGEDDFTFMQRWKKTSDLLNEFSTSDSAGISLDPDVIAEKNKALDEQAEMLRIMTPLQKEYIEQLEKEAVARELSDRSTAGNIPIDDDTTTKRRIKFATPFKDDNSVLIAQLKQQIKLNTDLQNLEYGGKEQRQAILDQTIEDLENIALLELEDARLGAQRARVKEKLKWESTLSAFEEGSEQYEKQDAEYKKGLIAADNKYYATLLDVEEDYKRKSDDIGVFETRSTKQNVADEVDYTKNLLKLDYDYALANADSKIALTAKGTDAERKAIDEKKKLQIEYHNAVMDMIIARLVAEYNATDSEAEKERIYKTIKATQALKTEFKTIEEQLYTGEDAWKNWAIKVSETIGEVGKFVDQLFENRIQQIDDEISKNEEKYDRLLELAKNDEAETKILERNKALREKQLAKEKRALQIKQAKFQKALNLQQAIVAGAIAVITAFSAQPPPLGQILGALTSVAVAAQIATIVATPIPAFAKGGVMTYDGKAQINDGGNQEYIERNGGILTTMQTNAIVDLKKGDIIHKDYESLNKNSMIVSTLANGGQLTESDFERMYSGIEKSIEKGFNKARINNKVTVLNKVDTYRDKMQNWS